MYKCLPNKILRLNRTIQVNELGRLDISSITDAINSSAKRPWSVFHVVHVFVCQLSKVLLACAFVPFHVLWDSSLQLQLTFNTTAIKLRKIHF